MCKLLSEITFPESEKAECIKTPDLKTGMDLMARSQSVLMVNYANIFIPLYTLISPIYRCSSFLYVRAKRLTRILLDFIKRLLRLKLIDRQWKQRFFQ